MTVSSPGISQTCSRCGNSYPATPEFFLKERAGRTRLVTRTCRSCHRGAMRSVNARMRFDVSRYLTSALCNARLRAEKGGLSFTIERADIDRLLQAQDGRCALSGVEMTISKPVAGMRMNPTNISIDRIRSDSGYDPDNVHLVCTAINLMKSQHTCLDFVEWCRRIVAIHDAKESHDS